MTRVVRLPVAALPPAAHRAYVALLRAHRDVDQRGQQVPCATDPEAWTGDALGRDDVAAAVAGCQTCPLLGPCGAYADLARERVGVWGGRPRARATGRPRRKLADAVSPPTAVA